MLFVDLPFTLASDPSELGLQFMCKIDFELSFEMSDTVSYA